MNIGSIRTTVAEKVCFLVMEFSQDEFSKEQAFELFRENDVDFHREFTKQLSDAGMIEFVRYGHTKRGWQNNFYRMTERAQEVSNQYLDKLQRVNRYIKK